MTLSPASQECTCCAFAGCPCCQPAMRTESESLVTKSQRGHQAMLASVSPVDDVQFFLNLGKSKLINILNITRNLEFTRHKFQTRIRTRGDSIFILGPMMIRDTRYLLYKRRFCVHTICALNLEPLYFAEWRSGQNDQVQRTSNQIIQSTGGTCPTFGEAHQPIGDARCTSVSPTVSDDIDSILQDYPSNTPLFSLTLLHFRFLLSRFSYVCFTQAFSSP